MALIQPTNYVYPMRLHPPPNKLQYPHSDSIFLERSGGGVGPARMGFRPEAYGRTQPAERIGPPQPLERVFRGDSVPIALAPADDAPPPFSPHGPGVRVPGLRGRRRQWVGVALRTLSVPVGPGADRDLGGPREWVGLAITVTALGERGR